MAPQTYTQYQEQVAERENIREYIVPDPALHVASQTTCRGCVAKMLVSPYAQCNRKVVSSALSCVPCMMKKKTPCAACNAAYRAELEHLIRKAKAYRMAVELQKPDDFIKKAYAAWLAAAGKVKTLYELHDPVPPKDSVSAAGTPSTGRASTKRKADHLSRDQDEEEERHQADDDDEEANGEDLRTSSRSRAGALPLTPPSSRRRVGPGPAFGRPQGVHTFFGPAGEIINNHVGHDGEASGEDLRTSSCSRAGATSLPPHPSGRRVVQVAAAAKDAELEQKYAELEQKFASLEQKHATLEEKNHVMEGKFNRLYDHFSRLIGNQRVLRHDLQDFRHRTGNAVDEEDLLEDSPGDDSGNSTGDNSGDECESDEEDE